MTLDHAYFHVEGKTCLSKLLPVLSNIVTWTGYNRTKYVYINHTLASLVTSCRSYTIVCPPVRGDNPRALASGLFPVQVDNHGITNLYYISVEHVHYDVFHGKVDNGSIHCSG